MGVFLLPITSKIYKCSILYTLHEYEEEEKSGKINEEKHTLVHKGEILPFKPLESRIKNVID